MNGDGCVFFPNLHLETSSDKVNIHKKAKQTTRSNMLKAACVTRNFTTIDLSSSTVKAITLQQQTAMSFAVSGLSSWLSCPNQGRARTLCLCSSQQHLTKPHSGSGFFIWSQVDRYSNSGGVFLGKVENIGPKNHGINFRNLEEKISCLHLLFDKLRHFCVHRELRKLGPHLPGPIMGMGVQVIQRLLPIPSMYGI